MNISKRVRALRIAAGLTQLELATRAGVSLRTVAKVELSAEANPTIDTIRALAEALGASTEDLVRRDDGEIAQELAS